MSEIKKDEHGCPLLKEPEMYFGISHTKRYVACVISRYRCGCDVEQYQERILNMDHRFMTEKELLWAQGDRRLKKSHLIWGVKESSFKTWGRKQIDWKKHIRLDNIRWNPVKGEFKGTIGNHTGTLTFKGGYEYFSEVLFVWTVETRI